MTTNKYTFLTITFLIIISTLMAQNPQYMPKVEEMHERKWQHILENTNLSAKEIEAVRPVFLEYEKSMWNLFEKNRENFRKGRIKGNTKLNYAEINEQFINREIKQTELLKIYHQKLTKILNPETLFNYYRAERAFKRNLLQNMQGRPLHKEN